MLAEHKGSSVRLKYMLQTFCIFRDMREKLFIFAVLVDFAARILRLFYKWAQPIDTPKPLC